MKRIWRQFIYRIVFGIAERLGLHLLPADYTSPAPNTRDLNSRRPEWYFPSEMPGIALNFDGQLALLHELGKFQTELAGLPLNDILVRQGMGLGYGDVEAHVLYAMIRSFRPQLILEVGSGVSTFYSHLALKKNACGNICCIEPYPTASLAAFAEREGIAFARTGVQSVKLSDFENLQANDILFIDSSHIVKLGSDVWYLFLEVLPRLRAGVLVHIHDIHFPYPCPEPDEWIMKRRQFWNESALLQAILCGNSRLQVIFCTSLIADRDPEALNKAFPIFDPIKHSPASIWLRAN